MQTHDHNFRTRNTTDQIHYIISRFLDVLVNQYITARCPNFGLVQVQIVSEFVLWQSSNLEQSYQLRKSALEKLAFFYLGWNTNHWYQVGKWTTIPATRRDDTHIISRKSTVIKTKILHERSQQNHRNKYNLGVGGRDFSFHAWHCQETKKYIFRFWEKSNVVLCSFSWGLFLLLCFLLKRFFLQPPVVETYF